MACCRDIVNITRVQANDQGCSLGLERLGLEAFFERLGLEAVFEHPGLVSVSIPSLQCLGPDTPTSQSRDSNVSVSSRSRHYTSHLQPCQGHNWPAFRPWPQPPRPQPQRLRIMQHVFAQIQWLFDCCLHSLHKIRCECETINK